MLTKSKITPFKALELLVLYQFDNNTIGSLLSIFYCIYMYLNVLQLLTCSIIAVFYCIYVYFYKNLLIVGKMLAKIKSGKDFVVLTTLKFISLFSDQRKSDFYF